MNTESTTKQKIKATLRTLTGCGIQHTGWPCGSCFMNINDWLTNQHWQMILWYRGDYKKSELNNLPPKLTKKNLENEVIQLIEKLLEENEKLYNQCPNCGSIFHTYVNSSNELQCDNCGHSETN